MKFALQVEMVLNKVPQPEFRQLIVEAMMILCIIADNNTHKHKWYETIQVEHIVHEANNIFIAEQVCRDQFWFNYDLGQLPRMPSLTQLGFKLMTSRS